MHRTGAKVGIWSFRNRLFIQLSNRSCFVLRMLSKEEAVGTRTGEYIQKAVEDAELVVVAWGDHGSIYNRQEEVERF